MTESWLRLTLYWFCLVLAAAEVSTSVAHADYFDSACDHPIEADVRVRPANPANFRDVLAAASGGDTVVLDRGNYGDVTLSGVNSQFVTIRARSKQAAQLSSLTIKGNRWRVEGLTINGATSNKTETPTAPGRWPLHDTLVKIIAARNIILADNVVESSQLNFPWHEELVGVDDFSLFSGIYARNATCISVSRNHVTNVFSGIVLEGDQIGDHGKYFRIEYNHIDNFAGDGIDHAVSFATIRRNLITDIHDICEQKCIHSDGIQGWNFQNKMGIVNTNVVIDGNIIISQTVADMILPGKSLQGITIFDGFWKDVTVINNVVVTNAFHGISLAGVDGLLMENNTEIANTERATWMMAGGTTHQGGTSRNVIVRNNIVTSMNIPKSKGENIKVDHNLEASDPKSVFVKFSPSAHLYDLHLKTRSTALGRGSRDQAPDHDITGAPRSGSIDLGAYQQSK